ncbi:hypothetical protein [Pseudophaeobacter sp. EL27]|nr:hypothetical protein [Pseudophaeobacter sp. EL27]
MEMKNLKVLLPLGFVLALSACQTTTVESQKTPSPAEQAEIEAARANLIAAECALYEGTGVTPEQCQ